ncbi:hypothetical protein Tco_0695382 [Tanacetum coccineum]
MFNKKNVDYVALLWEDFMYQADNREISSARKEHMPYLRFTKVIINHFISKDKTISMRNGINLHTIRDDSFLGVVIRVTPGMSVSKKKAPAKADRSKGIEILSDVALSKAAQLKEATKRKKKDFHISQASGSGDENDFESGVHDEQQCKTSGTDEGTNENDDFNDDDFNDDDESDNDNDSENEDDDGNDAHDSEKTNSDDDDEKKDDDLYKDVEVRSLGAEHEKERKGDLEMTEADQNIS